MVILEVTVGIHIYRVGSIVVDTFGKSAGAFVVNINEAVSRDTDNRTKRFAV